MNMLRLVITMVITGILGGAFHFFWGYNIFYKKLAGNMQAQAFFFWGFILAVFIVGMVVSFITGQFIK